MICCRHGQSTKCGCVIQVVGLPTLRMSKHKDLLVDNGTLLIPRNTTIWIPLGLPHASSAIYKDADQFIPERWLEPDAEYMPTPGETYESICSIQLQQMVFCPLL